MKVKDEIVDDAYADDYDEGELDKPLFDSDGRDSRVGLLYGAYT